MRKQFTILLLLLIGLGQYVFAQTTSWVWAKNLPYNENTSQNQEFLNSCIDSEDNIYMLTRLRGSVNYGTQTFVGTTSGGVIDGHFVLSKTDKLGNLKWGILLKDIVLPAEDGTYKLNDYLKINSQGHIYLAYKTPLKTVPYGGFPMTVDTSKFFKIDVDGKILANRPLVTVKNVPARTYLTGIELLDDATIAVIGNTGTGQSLSSLPTYYLGGIEIKKASAQNKAEAFIGVVDTSGQGKMAKYIDVTTTSSVKMYQYRVNSDSQGNIYVAGSLNGNTKTNGNHTIEGFSVAISTANFYKFVYKCNQQGEFQWVKYLYSTELRSSVIDSYMITDIKTDNEGNYVYVAGNYVTGVFENGNTLIPATNPKNQDGFLIKLKTDDGTFEWGQTFFSKNAFTSSALVDYINTVCVDSYNNPIVFANLSSQDCIMSMTSAGGKLDSLYRGANSANRTNLLIGKENTLYETTDFTKSSVFGSFSVGRNGNHTSVIIPAIAAANVKVLITNVDEQISESTLTVYPNPTNGKLTIYGLTNQDSEIEVYNLLGSKVLSKTMNVNHNSLDVSNLNQGVYLLKVNEQLIKFIKE